MALNSQRFNEYLARRSLAGQKASTCFKTCHNSQCIRQRRKDSTTVMNQTAPLLFKTHSSVVMQKRAICTAEGLLAVPVKLVSFGDPLLTGQRPTGHFPAG